MKEVLKKIEKAIADEESIDISEVQGLLLNFLKEIHGLHIKDYIGDYPTFIEPIYLGNKVKIGDDVLLGPNVYIGNNSEIGDNCELLNSIVFENVKIGKNFKLENCIIVRNIYDALNNLASSRRLLPYHLDITTFQVSFFFL